MEARNVDLVRSLYAAWERGDYQGMAEVAHPEIEFVLADGPEPGSVTGWTQMEAWLRRYRSTWEDYRTVLHELRELDDERVLVLFHRSGRGRMSGLELGQFEEQGANLLHLRDGKVTRGVIYFDRDRALADLGLAQEGQSP
jgi:ketosteroid isomerase-like protein